MRRDKNKKKRGDRFGAQNKLSLFKKPDLRTRRSCPLSNKDAPQIDYKNIKLLRKYVSDTGKILPSRITSVSQNKQRKLSLAIKRAQFLGLIQIEVILLENIRNLGKIGEIVKVKDGYGRNFLLKTGKALRADEENKIIFKKKKEEIVKKNTENKNKAKKIFDKIKSSKLIFKKETKENGDLFGTIKPREISSMILEKFKETIHPSQIDIKKEINKSGSYPITVNLHSEVLAELQVVVEKKESK